MQVYNILVPKHTDLARDSSSENVAYEVSNTFLQALNKKMHVGRIFHEILL